MITATNLEYTKKGTDLKDILETVDPIKDDARKMELEPFPSITELVTFAEKAYEKSDRGLRSKLPKGWQLLTTARGGLNGYFGCAYWNSSLQQVVLAHRGTNPLNPGDLIADISGVGLNKYTSHMFSAVTFGDEIKRAILDANMTNGVRFTLSITGHSLGGWLAQVTAITIKNLKRQDSVFVSDISESLNTHTVAFDSPGVEDMAIKIQRDYRRYGPTPFSMFQSLDVTNFFMAANLVNATGFHAGSMYQVPSNLIFKSGFTNLYTNLSSHSITNFVEAFKGDGKQSMVKDWCQGWMERNFPATVEGQPVHYKIEKDLGTSAGLNSFSEKHLELIKWIHVLRKNAILNSEIETFFTTKNLFPNFTICRKQNIVECDSEQHLKRLVKSTVNALRWYSCELQVVLEKQIKLSAPSFLLDMASQECLDSISDLPACEDTLELREFTENTARVLYVQTADCRLEMARILNILFQLKNKYAEENHFVFLNATDLLKINKHLKIEDFPLTNDYLWVVNLDSVTNKEVLEKIFSNLKKHIEKKVVIVSLININSDMHTFVKSFESELPIRCLPLSEQECLQFKFTDLKDTSREELSSRKFIFLGEQAMSLNTLLGENYKDSDSIDEVLKHFLKDVLLDENFMLNIHNNSVKSFKLDVTFTKICRKVTAESLTGLLRKEKCSLFVSSGARQLLEPQLQKEPEVAERVREITGSSEEEFRKTCFDNPSTDFAYWLTATDGCLFVKQIYNTSLNLSRQFHDQSLVDLDKLVRKENTTDLFVFSGVDNTTALMEKLNASSEVKQLFCQNLRCKMQSEFSSEGNDQRLNLHKLKVEGHRLVWEGSQGALDNLLPYLRTDETVLLDEKELCHRRAVIISGQPGVGKSTTLTNLPRHLDDSWTLRVNLRDRRADITNLPSQMSLESAAHFLAGAKSEPATRCLLRFCLWSSKSKSCKSRQVHVLLDGFDEIRDESAMEKVVILCHFLINETTANIIVTTRDSYKDLLTNRLSTVATIFEDISEENQLIFLINFWHSHAALEAGSSRQRLRLFARQLYKAAHEQLGRDIIKLIGIPLHMTMLAEAFLQQAKEFIGNAESKANIIGINNVYNLYKLFTGVKRKIYLEEKLSMDSDKIVNLGDILYEGILESYHILAFRILDPEFKNKYLPKTIKHLKEMNRFGLTQWNNETQCDFIHRTFAEYFCSELLVLWLRRDSRLIDGPIEEWFLGNLMISRDFEVVRKFIDGNLAQEALTADSKQHFYNNMIKLWSVHVETFRDGDGQTALHVAVNERNPNIIAFLLGGLEAESTRGAFESFLIARDYDGNTALAIDIISRSHQMKTVMQNIISHLPKEMKFKHLLYSDVRFESHSNILLEDALSTEEREDIQSALDRLKVLRNKFQTVLSEDVQGNNTSSVEEFISNQLESGAEREYFPLAIIDEKTAVNIASGKGNLELVKVFAMANRDVLNSRDGRRRTPLHCAAMGGHSDVVDYLVAQGVKLNMFECHGMTPLICVVANRIDIRFATTSINISIDMEDMQKRLKIVKTLVSLGADVNMSDDDGMTPLHHAVGNGSWEIAEYLLECKANPNVTDDSGCTPLKYAVKNVDLESREDSEKALEIVKKLVSLGADVNMSDDDGMTPLHGAIENGSWEIAEYLLECKANPNVTDDSGCTPLIYAVKNDDLESREDSEKALEIVKKLVSLGADVNMSDDDGMTPLHGAIENYLWEIAEYLLECKANPNAMDNYGRTPLIYAVKYLYLESREESEKTLEIVKKLVSLEADVNMSDDDGMTPLHGAIDNDLWEIAEYLLECKANPNAMDNYGRTPLIYAVYLYLESREESEKTLEIVKKLVSLEADVNMPDRCGMTALHYAIGKGCWEIAEYLLECKANPNVTDNKGGTPLVYAVKSNNLKSREDSEKRLKIVKKLVSLGADVNMSDEDGMTPLDHATKGNNNQKIIDYLRSLSPN